MKKSCPVNTVNDCFLHKSCLLISTYYKTRRDTPYNGLYEDTPPGRKGYFFHPRVMSKISNLESEAYRKRAKEKRIFYTECFGYLVLFFLDKNKRILLYLRFWSGIRRFDLEHETKSVFCRNAPRECFEETVASFIGYYEAAFETGSKFVIKTVPWCNSAKILPSLERIQSPKEPYFSVRSSRTNITGDHLD